MIESWHTCERVMSHTHTHTHIQSVDELMGMPDIDGCLVGGASLDPVKFTRIMNFQ